MQERVELTTQVLEAAAVAIMLSYNDGTCPSVETSTYAASEFINALDLERVRPNACLILYFGQMRLQFSWPGLRDSGPGRNWIVHRVCSC